MTADQSERLDSSRRWSMAKPFYRLQQRLPEISLSGDMLCGAPDYAELGSAARADPGICLERYSA